MTRLGNDPGFDQRIADWLEHDPHHAPGPVLDTVLAALPSVPQRQSSVVSGSVRTKHLGWLGVAAVIVVVAIGAVPVLWDTAPSWVGGGPAVSAHQTVSTTWVSDPDLALTIRRDPLIDDTVYWRTATYDRIQPTGWEQSDVRIVTRPAHSSLVEGTIDDPGTRQGLRTLAFTVIPVGPNFPLVSPATPVSAGENVRLTLIGEAGFFGAINRDGSGTTEYQITALTPVRGSGQGELNAAALRTAGDSYPTEIIERYLDVDDGIIGPNALALQQKIETAAASHAPIDLVEATMAELRSNAYVYDTDVSDLNCEGLSTAECFATNKRGFCQYYASTMAVLLRSMGVPSRIAAGFLPGQRDGQLETIRKSDAHVWVEVYFPSYEWVTFDPTGATRPRQLPAALPTGA
jgi:transglutaminase-like putative cysteine protease